MATSNAAHSVAHVDAIEAARAAQGSMMNRKDHSIPLKERNDIGSRLHPRPLLREDEFAAFEIGAWRGEQHSHLQREDVLSVKILVQTVVVARSVSKKQGRGPNLPRAMTTSEEFRMPSRKAGSDTHRLVPSVRHRGKTGIQRGAKAFNEAGKRVREVLVLAATKAVARHDHATSERVGVVIHRSERAALIPREEARENGAAPSIEFVLDRPPVG